MKTKKCPVCDWELKNAGKTVKLKNGAAVVVCCDDCAEKVRTHPEKYLEVQR